MGCCFRIPLVQGFTSALLLVSLAGCRSPLADLDDAHRDLSAALPVFPGAEGFGTGTSAGRGGEILTVTHLGPDGPGSLRQALSASGPRTVVFEVSGTIWIDEVLHVGSPFLTIAGQTAPSPGITVAGAGLRISTHDVLVQHLRFRPGDLPSGPRPKDRDAVQIIGDISGDLEVFNVVVDHCSMSWATDEVASSWYKGIHDITWSNNLITEGLWRSTHPEGSHSMGLLIGDHSRRVAVLRNVFAHNNDRNPVIGMDVTAVVVNNFIYDPGSFAVSIKKGRRCCPSFGSVEGNRVVSGPGTLDWMLPVRVTRKAHRDSRMFVADNGEVLSDRGDETWASTPPVSVLPLTVMPSDDVEATLVRSAGARPLDRDPVDVRIIDGISSRTGGPIDSQEDVGGWPVLDENTEALQLPDAPHDDDDDDGYTNLEEWLHSLSATLEGR